uniref:Uncharacterized protein n=1 Tax=Aegilops tauschii subsp. strangulata TaxID=200361 RepID=A0A453EPE9_AEGTS
QYVIFLVFLTFLYYSADAKRPCREGLSPLMFTFALVGNTTYVGSILVNSLDWARLRPNLPWLVDAGGCVLLDSFIILQFLYFHYRNQSGRDELDNLDKA